MSKHEACPFCRSEKTKHEDTEFADDYVYLLHSCECGLWFYTVYEYSHTEDEDGISVEVSE